MQNLDKGNTEESSFDVETRYYRDGRFKVSFEDVMTLIDKSSTLPAQAMAEGGYRQLSQEQNQEIAKKLVAEGITYLMRSDRGSYNINQLMQVVTRAGLSPEETMVEIQKLMDAKKKLED